MTLPIGPETIKTALELYVFAKTVGVSADVLKMLAAEPMKDVSEIIAHYSTRPIKNFLKVGDRSRQMLTESGKVAQPIPLRTLQPIVDGASHEESPEMQELWAALLANAATAGADIPPLYPRILSSLSPNTARVLNRIELMTAAIDRRRQPPPRPDEANGPGHSGFALGEIERPPEWIGESFPELTGVNVLLAISELESVGVVEVNPPGPGSYLDDMRVHHHATDHPLPEYRLTVLGVAFMRACHAPAPEVSAEKATE